MAARLELKGSGFRLLPSYGLALSQLPRRVVSIPRLDRVILLFGCDLQLVIARRNAGSWCIAHAVLIAQIFFDGTVDLVDGLLFGNFKQAAARFLGDAFEHFFAVGGFLLR